MAHKEDNKKVEQQSMPYVEATRAEHWEGGRVEARLGEIASQDSGGDGCLDMEPMEPCGGGGCVVIELWEF